MTPRVLITKLMRHAAGDYFRHLDDQLVPGTNHDTWGAQFDTGGLHVTVLITVTRPDQDVIVIPEREQEAAPA